MEAFDIHQILRYLPHRFPFLMVDRVTACTPGESLEAIKNVSINEPYFPGHFPVKPVMPGVLILEALAQATGLLAFKTQEHRGETSKQQLYLFVGIDEARFRRQVEPGDQLHLKVELLRVVRGIWRFSAVATVDGEVVTTATLMCAGKDIDA
ncbi:3-hydroxyacyl-[acyl-carrier-protein] dehydratase [Ectothiorhodosinus mongolicus]|uniref:3-hydroxyacyl-[acyl-carrier-protein] dehydratase FabZ n=1 Tax=Ectothiorhodosinus mongolicus TaxID=233100 RepID=A0A1R3VRW8_9GAMM|nr:3-hydroxyacyl-ACP dehydratase FabZ [Ectothiorhodosinus mongolicus]ULX56357.1 3-hydroxyacyl-[acyl-carrier-protein] dehydratase FabZ [Ectothiorhodosinus mongolicus]SIT65872.1 3-hydroxyacyl-[acyl-carrier-protein] dehydratase [Ectothiorhodosinus mongolicus]